MWIEVQYAQSWAKSEIERCCGFPKPRAEPAFHLVERAILRTLVA
jgi:hypothetical protein